MSTFSSLGLAEHLLGSIRDLGFDTPTPIQERAIPLISAGRDVVGEAQTGSGKTAAFVLPILQRLCKSVRPRRPQITVLTLAPTRELAIQVAGVFESLAKGSTRPVAVLGLIGGEPIEPQIQALGEGVDVVVATPGRLLDLVDRGVLDLSGVRVLVLDEADRLVDLGFSEELGRVLDAIPPERQTVVFSATLPQRVLDLTAHLLSDPAVLRVDELPVSPDGIHERVIEVDREQRRVLLQHLIKTQSWGRTIVFVATRRAAENLAVKLRKAGIWTAALHGGLDQSDRIGVLAQFKSGRVPTLVATDIAARGLDVPDLGAVVNFDLPRSPRDYLHRIGRTGRAGVAGVAVSFVDHESAAHFRVIEKQHQFRLPRERVAGFELSGPAPKRSKGKAPVKGKRKSKKDKLREKAAEAARASEGEPRVHGSEEP